MTFGSSVWMSKKTPVWFSCPWSCFAFGKIKGVGDNLVFLLITCLTYAKLAVTLKWVSCWLALQHPPKEQIVVKMAPAGKIVVLKQQWHTYAEAVVLQSRKKKVLVEVALPDGHLYSSSCSSWRNRVGGIFQVLWHFRLVSSSGEMCCSFLFAHSQFPLSKCFCVFFSHRTEKSSCNDQTSP